MPKSTSTFIKSKMNKDTDSRILPSGEYRDAQNVSISKSEGADVGALENILGNRALVDINSLLGANIKNLEVIGHYMDTENDRIFFMLTNYNDSSSDNLSNFAPTNSNHYIYCYNINNTNSTQLVAGNFLNFSKTHRIYGINLIEDLLFWTDNRNQPRKINVESALSSPATSSNPYYINEDQISVAKYYPYNPIRLYKTIGPFIGGDPLGGTITNTAPGATMENTYGQIQVGDKIVVSSPAQTTEHMVVRATSATNQNVRVSPTLSYGAGATFTFYRSLMKDVVSEKVPRSIGIAEADVSNNPFYDANWPGDPNFLTDKFVRFSYRYKFDDGEYSLIAPFTQPAFIPKQDGYFMNDPDGVTENNDLVKTYVSTIVDFMENKVNDVQLEIDTPSVVGNLHSEYKIKEIQLLYKESDSTNIKVLANIPYTDSSISNHFGTANLALTDAGTGTYSGGSNTPTGGSGTGMVIDLTTDNSAGGGDGTPVSATITDLGSGYVNGDTIYPTGGGGDAYFTLSLVDSNVFSYNYQSRKPIATIPADQTTRVYDKVPVRALAQETAGNRIIYGNYINKHTSPTTLDYEVKSSDKLEDYQVDTAFSTVQYPTHSLKQNRSYQVGIVLSDKFGRQSDVILSNVTTATTGDYGGSTVFSDYRTSAENTSKNVLQWFGESLKVIFNSQIPSTIPTPGYPGLYSETNPLGWYSYKVVVKQQEQEYYNVYLPGILNGYPFESKERGFTAFSTLYSDNVNKIPKDLQDIGPVQASFRSGQAMWGRVENFPWTGTLGGLKYENSNSKQYYPSLLSDEATEVGTMTDLKLGVVRILRAQNVNVLSITRTNPGNNYNGPGIAVDVVDHATSTGGSGSGLTLDASINAAGNVTSMSLNNSGNGLYQDGDVVTLTAVGGTGTGATARINGGGRINNFLLSSYNPSIEIGMSVNSALINTEIVETGKAIDIIESGSGYSAGTYTQASGDLVLYPSASGGSGVEVTVAVDANGSITTVTTSTPGTGYDLGDVLVLTGGGGTGAKFVISTPTIIDYTEYEDTENIVLNSDAVKAQMTISVDTLTCVPNDEIFKINERGKGLFYNSSSNPYLAKISSLNAIGTNNADMQPVLAVYETKPTFSNLDIYWETSTAGLISELNTAISSGDTTSPFGLRAATGVSDPIVFDFNENDAIDTSITPTFKAIANPSAPAFITSNITMTLSSVLRGNSNVLSQFTLVDEGSGGYSIKTNSTFACSNIPNNRNYIFNIQVDTVSGGNTLTNNFQLNTVLQNTAPTLLETTPGIACGDDLGNIVASSDVLVATFSAVNGSASTTLNTDFLSWIIQNSDGTLYTGGILELRDPITPEAGRKELWVRGSRGTYSSTQYNVRVIDGPGAVADCNLTFSISPT